MKNLIIFSVFFLVLACKTSIYIDYNYKYEDIRKVIRKHLQHVRNKKSGTFLYPKVGIEYSLKKGKLNGIFQFINLDKDTIFYCNFKNGRPFGLYKNRFYEFTRKPNYFKLFHNIDLPCGEGYYNKNHQKHGNWYYTGFNHSEYGYYLNDKKEGVWIFNIFSDNGDYNIREGRLYEKGKVKCIKFRTEYKD